MGKKEKKRKKNQHCDPAPCPDCLEDQVEVNVLNQYSTLDSEVAGIVKRMKERCLELHQETNLRVFLADLISLGARAVRLSQGFDEFDETMRLVKGPMRVGTAKDGMNRPIVVVDCNVPKEQEQEEVAGANRQHCE